MRIVSGIFKGRIIDAPVAKTPTTVRPTSDRVREAMFSSLESIMSLEGTRVLDLYAGTGALGLEAISRGAKFVEFVEVDYKVATSLKKTIDKFEISLAAKVVVCGVKDYLARDLIGERSAENNRELFDIVFADPPYAEHPGESLIQWLINAKCVDVGSIIIVESGKNQGMGDTVHSNTVSFNAKTSGQVALRAELFKCKMYGDTQLHYYRVITE